MYDQGITEFRAVQIPKKPKVQKWWIPSILPQGRLILLSAGGGVGKSSLCCYLAKALYEEQNVRTLYFAFEDDPTDFTNRIGYTDGIRLLEVKNVKHSADEYGEYTKTTTGFFNYRDECHWAQLGELMTEIDARVLVVDPITQLYGDDENDGQKVRQFMIKFRDFATKNNITVVAIHHNRKDVKTGANNARGSTSWTDVPRHHLTFAEDDAGHKFLEVYKTNLTKRGLSWEAYYEVKKIIDDEGNVGDVLAVTGLAQVEDWAVTNLNKRLDNTPVVIHRLKEKYAIGQPFNRDEVKQLGSLSEFYNWRKSYPEESQECKEKKGGQKAFIFI